MKMLVDGVAPIGEKRLLQRGAAKRRIDSIQLYIRRLAGGLYTKMRSR